MLALALVAAGGIFYVGLHYLGFLPFRRQPLSAGTLYDLLKVAFAFAAGVGGVVALVTAYRRQRVVEFAEEREAARLFNERFATAAGQLGNDSPAVQLAGLYAMAGLADDWPQQRQTCVDVLCAYLRMPYEPEPTADAPAQMRQAFRAGREVRHTVIRVIAQHLQANERRAAATQDWRGLNFDFTGVVFDGGDFAGAQFKGGKVSFAGAQFNGGIVSFAAAMFTGGYVDFGYALFTGGTVRFSAAQFSGGTVYFNGARYIGGTVDFGHAFFTGGTVDFAAGQFIGGTVSFIGAVFDGAKAFFGYALFADGTVNFTHALFGFGEVDFQRAHFNGSLVDLESAIFTCCTVSFIGVSDWKVPPRLPNDRPPALRLPYA
jgi:uncharacterized protein YjbI with pentapeptide repeats